MGFQHSIRRPNLSTLVSIFGFSGRGARIGVRAGLIGRERFTVPELDLNCVRVRELECPNALLSERVCRRLIGPVDHHLSRTFGAE